MNKLISVILLAIISVTFINTSYAAGTESIAAVVNDGVVTMSDLNSRVKLVTTSSGLKPNKEIEAKLRAQVLNMLIDEEIRVQEAEKLNMDITETEIDEGFAAIAKQNNMSPDTFKKMVTSNGVDISTMRAQIKAQLAWVKVVQKRVRPKININDADIDNELERLKEKVGRDQYLLAQIFIPVNDKSKTDDAFEFATKLTAQLRAEPDAFPKAAKQFSAAAGADKGGIIGWIMIGQLPKEIDTVLPNLKVGQINSPIKTNSGIYILRLNDKRQLAAENLPTRDEILEKLGMEKLDKAAKRYFQNLKTAAFVEKRG